MPKGERVLLGFRGFAWDGTQACLSCWFLCLCSCIFSFFKTISMHGVRHVQLLFVFRLRIVYPALVGLTMLVQVMLYCLSILAWFSKDRGSCDPNHYALCVQQQISVCIWLGGACLCFAKRLCGCCHQTPKKGRLKEQARLLLRFGVNDTTHSELIMYPSFSSFVND